MGGGAMARNCAMASSLTQSGSCSSSVPLRQEPIGSISWCLAWDVEAPIRMVRSDIPRRDAVVRQSYHLCREFKINSMLKRLALLTCTTNADSVNSDDF